MEELPELLAIGMTEDDRRAWQIFHPNVTRRTAEIIRSGRRFVHYTSAEVALSILREEEVWMRNSSTMNDISELEHGFELLRQVFGSPQGERFRQLLDGLFHECSAKTVKHFDEWLPRFRAETYLTCLSEHLDGVEDRLGRLSMWRAYGGTAGVALVLNQRPFASTSNALNAYSAPVSYLDVEEFQLQFDEVLARMEANLPFLQAMGEENVSACVFELFRSLSVATKHPGFAEEREWRIIHSPTFEPSERLLHDIKVVRGVPQSVYKIPMKDVPEEGLVGATIPDLIERVIIGPTDYPYAMAEAFARQLEICGLTKEEAWRRIVVSNIPLRST